MRNALKALVWGIAGVTVTGALILSAFAIAGQSLSSPSEPVKMIVPVLVPTRSADASPSVGASHSPDGNSTRPTASGTGTESPRSPEAPESTAGGGDLSAEDD